jgi:hypothetical protein
VTAPKWAGPAPRVVAEAIRDGFVARGYRAEIAEANEPRDLVVKVDGLDIAYIAADGMIQVHVRQDEEGRPVVDGVRLERRAA